MTTYKVIVRDRESGVEEYIDNLTREQAEKEAATRARDAGKQVYVSWVDSDGKNGYLNREGPTADCPGEPW